ncbi:unnamed protein product [Peniophora sp. CBMAI 1063]|nr:unnamed protein product [Peniophora sp. CBMAI 1063]
MSKPPPMKLLIETLCDTILDLPTAPLTSRTTPKTRSVSTTTLEKIISLGLELRTSLAQHEALPSPPSTPSPELLAIKAQLDNLTSKVDSLTNSPSPSPSPELHAPPTRVVASAPRDSHVIRTAVPRDASLDIVLHPVSTHTKPINKPPSDVRMQLHKYIWNHNHLQHLLSAKPGTPVIRAVVLHPDDSVRVLVYDQHQRRALMCDSSYWVKQCLPGYSISYGPPAHGHTIVVHGVPTTFKPRSEVSKADLAKENSHVLRDQPILNCHWLTHKRAAELRTAKTHSSLVIHVPTASLAQQLVASRVAFDGVLLRTEHIVLRASKCYNCFRTGHIAAYCHRPATCGNCAGPHPTRACSCPHESTPCKDIHECPHVAVNSATAAIALIRIPSPYGLNGSDAYRGPLLINPGGPGASGIETVLTETAQQLLELVGDVYDLVGFDPRGVGRSTPQAQRIPSQLQAAIWGEETLFGALPPLSIPGNVGLTLAKAEVSNAVYGQSGADYLPFINTPYTAEDMMQIVRAHGRDKLSYYGFSYGTVLGATVASLYPDSIERMVLDGVLDAQEYYAGNVTANLLDTDKAVNVFFQACYEAGPDLCAFYDSSAKQISANLDALYEQLKEAPIPVLINEASFGFVDYGMLRGIIRDVVYFPYQYFPFLAQGLALLQQGNGTAFFEFAGTTSTFSCDCANSTNPDNGIDALLTVGCNDAPVQNYSVSEWQSQFDTAAGVSEYAEVYFGLALRCQSWPVGTSSRVPSPSSLGGNTSAPILFVANTIDPATPHVGAVATSALFPGSALLTQNSTGHTSTSATSNCTASIVARYFVDASLPEDGTICQVEGEFFPAGASA